MTKHLLLIGLMALSGCGLLQGLGGPKPPRSITGPSVPEAGTEIVPGAATTTLGSRAVSAAALDKSTAAEKAAALAAPAATGERNLGQVTVALGPPAEQGIWLKTALVSATTMGRVETAAGKSLTVELRPGSGGALLSLAAFQALGLSLTDLPELTVFGP